MDKNVRLVAQPRRRIPFHSREEKDAKFKEPEDLGIVEPVDGPSHWVSRLCVVIRARHPVPTVEGVFHNMNTPNDWDC